MSFVFPTNASQVQAFAGALYGIQVGTVTMAQVNNDIQANGSLATTLNSYYSATFGSVATSTVASTVAANLGLTGDALASGTAYITAQLNGAAAGARGAVISSIVNLFGTLSADATFGAAATAWNTKIATAVLYTGATNVAIGTEVVASSVFTLTNGVDAINGTAGNETISGVLGTSGTYSVGDNIIGGAGTDTLNLIATTGTDGDGGLVTVNGVESINVRVLATAYASAGDQVSMNAADWTGVTTLSNVSSLAGTQLDVSGLADDTTIVLNGNTDINVAYNNTATGATANAVLVNAGSAGTATTIGSASATNTANFDFDMADSGFVTNVNLEVRGSLNLARIEAGSNVSTYTVTGTGNAALITNDTITSFNAAAAQGNIDATFEGASEVVAVGGAGNDVFRFGSTLTNSDSIDGGAGTDTVVATIGAFNRNLNTTNVEAATLAFTVDGGATFNASASTVASYSLVAGVASADASISSIADGATITVASDGLDDVTIDAASGAATMTLNLGSATGQVGIEEITISDVATLVINANAGSGVSGGTAAASASGITLDADVRTVVINTSAGETDLVVTDFSGAAVSSLTINSNGSGAITLTSGLETNTAISAITINAAGSDAADVTVGSLGGASAATADKLSTITLVGRNGADITIGSLDLGNGATAAASATIMMDAGSSSVVGTDAFDITTSGDFDTNLTVVAGQSSTIALGTVTLNAGTAASGASLNIASFTAETGSFVGIESVRGSQSGAQVTVGSIVANQDSTVELFGSGGMLANGTAGTAGVANVDLSDIRVTLAASANLLIGDGTGSVAFNSTAGAIGSINLTIADDATADIGTIDASSIAGITLSIAGDGGAQFGSISAAASIGAINVGVAASGSATFAAIQGAAIESITVSGAGVVSIGAVSAATIGTVDARQLTSGSFTINLSGVDGAAEVFLGNSTNTVVSGKGNDIITLNNGSGQDNVQYTTATEGTDQIIRFGAGSTGGDQIEFGTGLLIMNGSATKTDSTTVLLASATANGAITVSTSAGPAAHVVLLMSTAFASTAAMASAIGSGGSLEIGAGTGESTAGSIIVVWTDGTDSYVSLATAAAGKSGADAIITGTLNTVATLSGVTPGALVAANFDFV